MQKTTLNVTEFAIKEGAAIQFSSGTIKFSPDANNIMTLTMKFKLASAGDLQKSTKTGTPIDFTSCGVFDIGTTNDFKGGDVKDSLLIVLAGEGETNPIHVRSEANDVSVITGGVKGNHGTS